MHYIIKAKKKIKLIARRNFWYGIGLPPSHYIWQVNNNIIISKTLSNRRRAFYELVRWQNVIKTCLVIFL